MTVAVRGLLGGGGQAGPARTARPARRWSPWRAAARRRPVPRPRSCAQRLRVGTNNFRAPPCALGSKHASGTSARPRLHLKGDSTSRPISGRGRAPSGGSSAATPGPSSGVTWRCEAAQPHGGLARVLGADEVGGGRGLVGDRDHGRVQLAAGRSPGSPRQSCSGAQAGDADRDLALALAPGAAEGVGDDHRRAARERARAARGRRRRGRAGSRISVSGSAALEASTPALAQTKPWRVRQISRPGVGADELRRLGEHDLDVARVLAVLGGERAARARRA